MQMTYVINKAVEEECRGSTWTPGTHWMTYQDEKSNLNADASSLTFMSRLLKEIIRMTDPK